MTTQAKMKRTLEAKMKAVYGQRINELGSKLAAYQETNESLTARLAEEEKENRRLRGEGKFIVHTGECIEHYITEQEAIDAAQDAIQDWRDMADPDWPSEVENVWIARVVHHVEQKEYFYDDGKQFFDYEIAAKGGE